MELDDLKLALNQLDQRLEEQVALQTRQARVQSRHRLEDDLKPLARGQIWQILFGALTCFIGVGAWHGNLDHPVVFASGVILHIYGILTIAMAVMIKVQVGMIDHAAPVVALQKRLARLRWTFVVAGMVVGMPWVILWLPYLIALLAVLLGVHVTGAIGGAFWWSMAALGVAGIAGPWLTYRLAKANGRTGITRGFEDAFTGERLKRAQAQLDEIAHFERD